MGRDLEHALRQDLPVSDDDDDFGLDSLKGRDGFRVANAAGLEDGDSVLQRQFPFFLDLAVMTMGAGSSFSETTEIYVPLNPFFTVEKVRQVVGAALNSGQAIGAIGGIF